MKKFKDSGSEIEHEAFLALWLSRFVFPSSYTIANVSAIAVCLARGVRLALPPPVLASIYRDLSLLNNNLGNDGQDDESNLIVWAPFQLVQVWILERFRQISPNCVDSCNPRFARWENKKLRVANVGSFVDCGFDDFIWQPYGEDINDKSRKWVVVGDCLDEEMETWVRCLRVSELVGIDGKCIQQYLPHRVAMQFGMNQDVPGDVARMNGSREIAWRFYTRPIKDVKVYFPSQFSKPHVTVRYLEWWNKSTGECSWQSPVDDNEIQKFGNDESRNEGSKDSMDIDSFDTLGLDLEARISKLEEIFAYLKAKKNGEMLIDLANSSSTKCSPEKGTESSLRKGSNGDAGFSGSGGNFGNEINDSVLETPGNVGMKLMVRGMLWMGLEVIEGSNYSQQVVEKTIKRKKFIEKMLVDRASLGNYSSSNERPTKEPKQAESDPFNLEPIIWGLDNNVVKTRGQAHIEVTNPFQVLMEEDMGTVNEVTEQEPEVSVSGPADNEVFSNGGHSPVQDLEKEVADTVEFGGRLGAQLNGFEHLVSKAIEGEGLQSVIQETMLVDSASFDFSQVGGNELVGVDYFKAVGKSGGLISMWNPRKFLKVSSVVDNNFIVTTGSLIEDGSVINVVNVYAPQKVRDKRLLWDRLKGLIQGMSGMWVLLGDFNSVRWDDERKNSKFNKRAAMEFNSFIDEVCLQEYNMRGNRFTYLMMHF
ncbi:Aminotransferase-like mobile domain-containing protein [Artemisia annua]|uniref:Aminotransferase-like mobile domain-containing protein n=1 Tax=Artemisia annua TaxID=35608 RepID=A0A2U1NNS4_ARTAN|nr:Aminotransferase-like mobile domain-containing protein [Artemisia annua]